MKKKKEIIIKGYYGRGNLGDEMMLDYLASFFLNNYDGYDIHFMNSNPEYLYNKYGIDTPEELTTGSRGKSKILKRFIRIIKSDYYIIGGGTILTDKHGKICLIEYLLEFFFRKLSSKKNLIISIGSTEFKSGLGKHLVKRIIAYSTIVMVRDQISYSQLKKLSKNNKVILTGDLVFLSDVFNRIRPEDYSVLEKKIGICVMPYSKSLNEDESEDVERAKEIANSIDALIDGGYDVKLIPIQYGDNNTLDYDYSLLVLNLCKQKPQMAKCKTTEEKVLEIASVNCIVSMRLHAIVAGIMLNKRVIAINHNPKIEAAMNRFELKSNMIGLEDLSLLASFINRGSFKMADDKLIDEEIKAANRNIEEIKKHICKL